MITGKVIVQEADPVKARRALLEMMGETTPFHLGVLNVPEDSGFPQTGRWQVIRPLTDDMPQKIVDGEIHEHQWIFRFAGGDKWAFLSFRLPEHHKKWVFGFNLLDPLHASFVSEMVARKRVAVWFQNGASTVLDPNPGATFAMAFAGIRDTA